MSCCSAQLGLGATALSRLLIEQHVWLFSIGGALMIVGGVAVPAGWKPNLAMPGARRVQEGSFGSAYTLGAFSGLASACCAPVLVGVAVLSGASASFPAALAIGLSYVAGMVAPLALVALVWDRRRERARRGVQRPRGAAADRAVAATSAARHPGQRPVDGRHGRARVRPGLHRAGHAQRRLANGAEQLAPARVQRRRRRLVLDPGLGARPDPRPRPRRKG